MNPPKKKDSKNRKFVHGVEVDPILSPIAYHIWQRGNGRDPKEYLDRIERENFIHSVDPDRFDQTRGLSGIISAINDMQDTREALEAVKGAIKLENMLGVVWKTDLPNSANMDPLGLSSTYSGTTADGQTINKREVAIEQGAWSISLLPGESVGTVQKSTPSTQFEPWMLFQIRLASIVLDMPLEVALMYFVRGSFSSLKGAFGQYQYSVDIKRDRLRWQTCDRVAGWKVSQWVKRWRRLPASEREADPWALEPPPEGIDPLEQEWQWPQLPILEKVKQIQSDQQEYNTMANTLTGINARRNRDFEKTVRTQARELKRIDEIAGEEGVDPSRLQPVTVMPGQTTEAADRGSGDEGGTSADEGD
jgi:hypothetical protein